MTVGQSCGQQNAHKMCVKDHHDIEQFLQNNFRFLGVIKIELKGNVLLLVTVLAVSIEKIIYSPAKF